jgi:peptidylprolyl isomerase
MTPAQAGDSVTIHYTGRLEDGSVFDSSLEREPLSFCLGSGQVIAGFDHAVTGMSVGDRKTEIIPCDRAYGPRKPELIFQVARARIPPDMAFEMGQQLQFPSPTGEPVVAMVIDITPEAIILDANHPLAGEDLTFEIQLVSCRDPR